MVRIRKSRDASSSRGKELKSDLPFLSEDLFFYILVWLPADFLHYYARYVCKSWSVIISDPVFANEHFKRSKSGLFFQKVVYGNPCHGNYLGLREIGFEVEAVNGLCPGRLVSSSRGISLFYVVNPKNVLYVGNLTTRKFESLPSPISQKEHYLGCHITFVPKSSQYKVLYCVNFCKARKWRVWTLGSDQSWRNLEILPAGINLDNKLEKKSASAGGVLYLSKGKGAISAIDLNLETGYCVQVPNEFEDKLYWIHEMGDNLSFGVNQEEEIHVCVLKNSLTSEWLKVYKLRDAVNTHRFLYRTLVPIGWLNNNEKFVFIIREPGYFMIRYIVAYDVKTKETVIHEEANPGKIHVHTNSLVTWLEKQNCDGKTAN